GRNRSGPRTPPCRGTWRRCGSGTGTRRAPQRSARRRGAGSRWIRVSAGSLVVVPEKVLGPECGNAVVAHESEAVVLVAEVAGPETPTTPTVVITDTGCSRVRLSALRTLPSPEARLAPKKGVEVTRHPVLHV